MSKIQAKILSKLVEQYEKSPTFLGKNKVRQTFFVQIEKLFPRYSDSAEYDFYKEVNAELDALSQKKFIFLKKNSSGNIEKAILNGENLAEIYAFLKRNPRKNEQIELIKTLESFSDAADSALQKYIAEQKTRISQNKNVEYFSGDKQEFRDILKATDAVLRNDEEIFVRDFSIKLFGDSKRFEKIQRSVVSLLSKYGEFDDKENLLASCSIVKTPTYLCIKGNAAVSLGNCEGEQKIDLSKIGGDIAFSTETLKEIASVRVFAERVVTIENLTAFHDYKGENDFAIYLGGFHNSAKREFLKKVYRQNRGKEYLHFGDIDAGGFYILEHLKRKTEIAFKPLNMDIATLEKYAAFAKPLTGEDRRRLSVLQKNPNYAEIVSYMLDHNCKLEQEAER